MIRITSYNVCYTKLLRRAPLAIILIFLTALAATSALSIRSSIPSPRRQIRITSYNVCYTKLLRWRVAGHPDAHRGLGSLPRLIESAPDTTSRITSYNVCYTKLLRGPVFTQVLLADEINRGSPRTQSALLEAMAERQVSIDRETRSLSTPFFVIATQNPMDQAGTYPLPESQLDRFLMCLELGYPDPATEKRMLLQTEQAAVTPLLDAQQLLLMQHQVSQVHAADAVLDYLLALVQESRRNDLSPNALSPRASRALLAAARAWAYMAGRDYLLPDRITSYNVCYTKLLRIPKITVMPSISTVAD